MKRRRAVDWHWLDEGLPWLVVLLAALAFVVASQALRASHSPRTPRVPARSVPAAPQVHPSPNAERDPVCLGWAHASSSEAA